MRILGERAGSKGVPKRPRLPSPSAWIDVWSIRAGIDDSHGRGFYQAWLGKQWPASRLVRLVGSPWRFGTPFDPALARRMRSLPGRATQNGATARLDAKGLAGPPCQE